METYSKNVLRPMPDDFAEMAKKLGRREIMAYYSCGRAVLNRWQKEAGIESTKKVGIRSTVTPYDFADNAKEMTRKQLAEFYHCTPDTVSRWAKLLGVQFVVSITHQPRPMPADYPELARSLTYEQAMKRYGVASGTVERWREALGLKKSYHVSIPSDFAELAPTMSQRELRAHYRVGGEKINQWCIEAGVKYGVERPVEAKARKPHVDMRHVLGKRSVPALGSATVDRAAHFLRRFYSNVFRADIKMREGDNRTWGEFHNIDNKGRGFYIVDNLGAVPFHEVIELANKKGFSL